jgi:hypothetical protein
MGSETPLKQYTALCLEGIRKTTKNLIQDCQYPQRNLYFFYIVSEEPERELHSCMHVYEYVLYWYCMYWLLATDGVLIDNRLHWTI